MVRGFFVIPVVTAIVDLYVKVCWNLRFCGFQKRYVGEYRPPAGTNEGGVVGFRRLFKSVSLKQFTHRCRQTLGDGVLRGDFVTVFCRGGVRHGWSGGQRIGHVVGNVGNHDGYLLRWIRGLRHATAFYGRQVFANCIHFGDGSA